MDRTSQMPTSPTGIQVKHRLLDIGKRQSWLIAEMKKRNENMFMDSSYMTRLLDGTEKSAAKMRIIDQILTEEEERQKCNRIN